MTRDEMKQKLRTVLKSKPSDDSVIDLAIDEATNYVWNVHDWSFKHTKDTFSTTASTTEYALQTDVDTIIGMVYDTNNRVINPLPLHMVNERYDNLSRTDANMYWYVFKTATANKITIELVPTPDGTDTVTYWYLKRIDNGDLDSVPAKIHSIIFRCAREFFVSGDIEGNPSIQSALQILVNRDKPTTRKRSTMGLDAIQVNRINARNSISGNVSVTDTRYPID